MSLHFVLDASQEFGDLTHCFWSCSEMQKYWSDVLFEIQKVLKKELELDPIFLFLGLSSCRVTDMYQKKLYNVMTFCARKTFFGTGSQMKPPQLWDCTGQ